MNMMVFLRDSAASRKDHTAIVDGEVRISYGELYRRALALAGGIGARCRAEGVRCGYIAATSHESIELYYALSHIGGVFIPLDPELPEEELARRIRQTGAEILFVSEKYLNKVSYLRGRKLIPGVRDMVSLDRRCTGYISYRELLSGPEAGEMAEGTGKMNAVVFTSGRTAGPRAIAFSHDNFISVVTDSPRAARRRTNVTNMLCMPIHHFAGLLAFLGSFFAGNTLVLSPWTGPENWYRDIEKSGVELCFLAPHMLLELIESPPEEGRDISTLKGVRYGWDMTPAATIRRALEAFPRISFSQIYGLTDAVGTVLEFSPADYEGKEEYLVARRFGSSGRCADGSVIVADETGNPLPPGCVGELLVRPQVKAMGWLDENGAVVPLEGEWIHTRDMGYMDEDGYVYLVGFRQGPSPRESASTIVYPDIYSNHPYLSDGDLRMAMTRSDGAPIHDPSIQSILRMNMALQECESAEILQERYLELIQDMVPADLYGLYLLEDDRPLWRDGENGGGERDIKWIRPDKWQRDGAGRESWRLASGDSSPDRAQLLQTLSPQVRTPHLICAPLYSDGQQLLGILYFSRGEQKQAFRPRDEAVIRIAAATVCGVLTNLNRTRRMKEKNRLMEETLRIVGNAVLVSDRRGELRHINDSAIVILDNERAPGKVLETVRTNLQIMAEEKRTCVQNTVSYCPREDVNPRPLLVRSISGAGEELVVTVMNWVDQDTDLARVSHLVSGRTLEVLDLILQGRSNEEIAQVMVISRHTVNYHLQRLYRTFEVKSRSDLIVKAFSILSGEESQ